MSSTDPQSFGGQFLGSGRSKSGTRTYRAVNPADGTDLPSTFTDATPDEIRSAGEQAAAAFEAFSSIDPATVAAALDGIAGGLTAQRDAIVRRADQETGLGPTRLNGELDRTANQLRMFADLARDGSWVDARIDHADTAAGTPDLRRMLVGIGPVVVFGASNFPLAFSVAGGDTASALAARCPVIAKAHPSHPGTSELVAEVVTEAIRRNRLPLATFQMVHGADHDVGRALVEEEHVRAVGFTGSFAGGMALVHAAGQRAKPIPVFAEMGSLNPVLLFPNALQARGDEIAEAIAASVQQGVGQFCTKPGLLVAEASPELDAWLDTFTRLVNDGTPRPMLNAGIASSFEKGVQARSSLAGVELISDAREAEDGRGTPAIFKVSARRFLTAPTLFEELFGPTAVVVECEDGEQLSSVLSALEGSLTVTVHADPPDFGAVRALWPRIVDHAGRALFNGVPTGVAVSPAMHHGGPFPATSDMRFTSVGTAAVYRFARPVCYQNVPPELLPPELQEGNPRGIRRMVDGKWD